MTVKSTAQMLQKFGTDLAETELPNDIQCTKDLLVAHTDKHDKLRVSRPGLRRVEDVYQTQHGESCLSFGLVLFLSRTRRS